MVESLNKEISHKDDLNTVLELKSNTEEIKIARVDEFRCIFFKL